MDLQQYRMYNSSFRRKFVYRLGGSAGFFSEYNNMVLAILYCIVNRIQFVLESEEANFSSGKGWTEFFLPFCKEIKGKWLRLFNFRRKPTYKNFYERVCFNIYKRLHPNTIYMYSLFDTIRKMDVNLEYIVPEVGLRGTLLDNCKEIHRMIWRYNKSTELRITELIETVQLPKNYIGVHIRLGDKYEEMALYNPIDYMKCALDHCCEKSVFVLTDDYRSIVSLCHDYPEYDFYTLCQKDELGYNFNELVQKPISEQIQSYLRLWTSMDILEKAVLFVGTYSSNPGMNMGFRLDGNKIKCLDFNSWQLW